MTRAFKLPELGHYRDSLDNWNRYRKAYWDAVLKRNTNPELFPNGLKCPDCLGNLYDTLQQMTVHPPITLRVRCQNCKYRGERYE